MKNIYFKDVMDAQEFENLPQYDCIVQAVENSCAKFADSIAIVDGDKALKYAELEREIGIVRGKLAGLNILPGDKVGILMLSNSNFISTFLGIVSYGCVAVPLSFQIPKPELNGMAKNTDCAVVVCERAFLSCIDEVRCVAIDDLEGEYLPSASRDKDDLAAIMFTGGTTSNRSKAAMLSSHNLIVGATNGLYGFKGVFGATYVSIIPFTHIFGIVRGVLTGIISGSVIYTCPDPRKMVDAISKAQPTVLVLVPALVEILCKLCSAYGKNILGGKLRTIISGGAETKPSIIFDFKKSGVEVLPGYGLTETSNLVSGNKKPLEKPTSCGHPYDGQELKIVDGELWIKGENIMLGYYNNDAENARCFSDGWFRTGDIVEIDGDGDLYIKGRVKNVIVLDNGENVLPEEIEAKLYQSKFVQECLVYGDEDNSQLVAEILPNYQAPMSKDDIDQEVRNVIIAYNSTCLPYMRITKTVLRSSEFPKTGSLKIKRSN